MNKNLNHKGASKRKGAAESEELTEDGPAIDVADEGMAKKKGAAQVGYDAIIKHGQDLKNKRDAVKKKDGQNKFNAGILDSINMENQDQREKAKSTYGENYGQFNSKGNYIGEKTFKSPSEEALKTYMDFTLPGANRTGFTQDFGAARQNGYAKGAAKVNSIMNFGAAKGKGAAEYGGKKGDDSKSNLDYDG